ncbi:3-keto-5-aminohexanoate cleavage protein [uncultured Roseobacter sp.]|uniref:3-keto-5-aminohexanoate cleavage protein n=1 Tax=uncultured Roseobacter sp. TaxID=114847 RepID=UPI0026172E4F|nr:3-keto-5-aminohexanoate cleavage protein [uncultured Roseobacter sp.]
MARRRPVIITCAVTGAIHTPSMSAHLPSNPAEIIASAVDAAQAGAAILHLHARDEATGKPDQSVEGFARIVPEIRERTNAVLNLTTGGSPYMTVAERVRPAQHFAPQLASLNMGSMNMGLFPMLGRYPDIGGWEKDHLEGSRDLVFRNSYKDIGFVLDACRDNGTRFEFECYDTSHLYNLAWFADQGMIEPPFFVQTVFGLLGGIGAHPDDVAHMRRTAVRLFGDDMVWSVLGAGAQQMKIAAQSIAGGGHVRVGLEDSLWAGPGEPSTSNAGQVATVTGLIESLGCRVATSQEAVEILRLRQTSQV